MLYLKFSRLFIIILLLLQQAFGSEKFNSQQCLKSNFETSIQNGGKFFGLLKSELGIKKQHCIITVIFDEVIETKWTVDVCREPIHIKMIDKGNQSVYKRSSECTRDNPTEYCEKWNELHDILQDYGLIFARGDRENLATSHGQTYCAFLLFKEYLGKGKLFSKYDKPDSFVKGPLATENCELPKTSVEEEKVSVIKDKAVPVAAETEKDLSNETQDTPTLSDEQKF